MSRLCRVCKAEGRRSAMHTKTRHLHELEPGDRFRFEGPKGRPRDHGEVHALVVIGRGRCEISDTSGPERVEFETLDGKKVQFMRPPASRRRPCSSGAQVIPETP